MNIGQLASVLADEPFDLVQVCKVMLLKHSVVLHGLVPVSRDYLTIYIDNKYEVRLRPQVLLLCDKHRLLAWREHGRMAFVRLSVAHSYPSEVTRSVRWFSEPQRTPSFQDLLQVLSFQLLPPTRR